MKNGFKIYWTDSAVYELENAFNYLETYFGEVELKKLASEVEKIQKLIISKPMLFPLSNTQGVRRVVVKKYNTLYYRIIGDTIEVISFYINRKNPQNRILK